MKVNSERIKRMVRENLPGPMAINTKENFKTTNYTEKAKRSSLKERSIAVTRIKA